MSLSFKQSNWPSNVTFHLPLPLSLIVTSLSLVFMYFASSSQDRLLLVVRVYVWLFMLLRRPGHHLLITRVASSFKCCSRHTHSINQRITNHCLFTLFLCFSSSTPSLTLQRKLIGLWCNTRYVLIDWCVSWQLHVSPPTSLSLLYRRSNLSVRWTGIGHQNATDSA